MKSDNVSRWLTLGANIGVLIGIILLIVEINQNREMVRAQTRNAISQQLSARLLTVAANSQLASVQHRAEVGEKLTAEEEHQYFVYWVANMRDWENIHYQYLHGMFDDDEFEAERTTWRWLINSNMAFARNWCLTRNNYSPRFVAELESLLDEGVCATSQ